MKIIKENSSFHRKKIIGPVAYTRNKPGFISKYILHIGKIYFGFAQQRYFENWIFVCGVENDQV